MMRLHLSNPNYCATVVKIRSLTDLKGMDRCVGVSFFGYTAIVSKGSVAIGDIGLFFPPECQISSQFLYFNNLHRDKEFNVDNSKTGYFEQNGRVKALKMKGNISSGFFIPLSSLQYLDGFDVSQLNEGDTFDTIGKYEICRKYIVPDHTHYASRVRNNSSARKIENKLFPEHVDTENYLRNSHRIPSDKSVVVTQKLHGTSARFARQPIEKDKGFVGRVLSYFGFKLALPFTYLTGTRRTKRIAREDGAEQDVWDLHMSRIRNLIPKNWVIYGEIIGWTPEGKPIQNGYTYNLRHGESDFYVYRISVVNEDGISVDLSWDCVKEWCQRNGQKHVVEMFVGRKDVFDSIKELYMETKYFSTEFFKDKNPVPLSKDSPCDEGVTIRVDGLTPYILKMKSPSFLVYESNSNTNNVVNIEDQQGVDNA